MDLVRCLVADPPWTFRDALGSRGAAANYQLLSLDEIKSFALPPLADDAYLFLWRVAAMQKEALDVVAAWGFVAKSELIWRKLTKTGKPWFGMGRHVRASHETCIVATRGKVRPLSRSVRSVFEAKAGRHSEKPDEFYALVEQLAPGPRAELFARRFRPGWYCFGNELIEEAV